MNDRIKEIIAEIEEMKIKLSEEIAQQESHISYEIKNGTKPNTIEAKINLPVSVSPEKVLLFIRVPFEKPIKSVEINGKDWENYDQEKEAIVLPDYSKTLEVIVSY